MDPFLMLLLEAHPTWGDALLFLLAGQLYVVFVLWLLGMVCRTVSWGVGTFSPVGVPAARPTPKPAAQPAAAPAAAGDGGTADEVAAVVAAAVAVALDEPHRILAVQPATDITWAREGRRDHFSSHRVR